MTLKDRLREAVKQQAKAEIQQEQRELMAKGAAFVKAAPSAVLLYCEGVIVASLLFAGWRVANGLDRYLVATLLAILTLAMYGRFQAMWPAGEPIRELNWAIFWRGVLKGLLATSVSLSLVWVGWRLSNLAERVQFGSASPANAACEPAPLASPAPAPEPAEKRHPAAVP